MGRPKKVKTEGLEEASGSLKPPIFTEVALGVYRQEDGTYYIAELVYDPITGEASLQDLHSVGASKIEASERFKIEAVKKGFV